MWACGFLCMAGGQGFEPQLSDPESEVLPIKLSPIGHYIPILAPLALECKFRDWLTGIQKP